MFSLDAYNEYLCFSECKDVLLFSGFTKRLGRKNLDPYYEKLILFVPSLEGL